MAEISFNNKFDQMNKLNQQFYDSYFEDNYDPTKPMNQQSNSLTMKSLNDGSTTPDFAAMQSAYNDAQKSKTKNSFFSMSADAAMPDNFSGLQNSMGGLTLNPDGTLNYNNTQPQNLGFTSMVDMAADNENFMDQFNNTPRQMSPTGPFNFNNMGQVATNIESAPQPKGMSYEQMLDLGLVGPDQDVGMTAEDLQNKTSFFGNIKNEIGSGITGLRDFLPFGDKSLSGLAVKGIKGLFEKLGNGADYQQYDPNVDYSKFNPNMEINDFYDPRTKTNRFQRAKPGSFASFRTGADYFKARREKKAAAKAQKEQIAREASTAARARAANASVYSNAGVGSGGFASQNTGTNSNFSNRTGRGRTGYQDGGLASMFTRRR